MLSSGNEANAEHTRVLSGEKKSGAVLSGERSGGGSHWGEWRGDSVLPGTRGKAIAVSRAGRGNSETVAKRYAEAKAFSRPSLDSMRVARA